MKATIILVICLGILVSGNDPLINKKWDRAPPVNVSIRTDNNDNFEVGSPRVLACIVYGCVPSPNVTWYLGATMLRPNVYKEVNRGNFTVSSLTFVPSLTDDHKELVCKVTNNHMAETYEDRVTVSVGQRPICVDSDYKTIGAIIGDSETLVCIVESNPEPEQFIWTFADGRTIYTSSKKVSGHEKRYSSTLVWVPREDDFGPLYCRASNRFGEQKQPCTFSVINGGPPTAPECVLCWEDYETLKVQCEKNWDGGRPQTIHLEIKGADGTRKVSRKGHELKVNSLRSHMNITAELYASNSRGRSPAVQLILPQPLADEVPLQVFTSTQSRWAFWVQCLAAAIASLAALAMLLACFFKCAKDVCFRSGSSNTDINMRALELMNVDEVPNNYPRQPLRAPDDSATAYLSFNDEMAAHRYPFIGRSRRLKSSCHCTAVIGAEHCV